MHCLGHFVQGGVEVPCWQGCGGYLVQLRLLKLLMQLYLFVSMILVVLICGVICLVQSHGLGVEVFTGK